MNKTLRKYILNILGILIFAGIAAITIIIARGNRIDFNSGKIVETGTIRVFSQPEDVTVFLNEQKVSLNEKRIEGVDPGEYTLRIVHENYTSWEGKVEVNPGFITDVSVTLFPIQQNLEPFTQSNIQKVIYDRARSNAIYVVLDNPKGSEVGIWKKSLNRSQLPLGGDEAIQKITNLTANIDFVTKGDYNIVVSANAEKLIIANSDYSIAYILDTNRYNEPVAESMINLDYPISSINFIDNSFLLITSGNLLIEYNISSGQSTLLYYHPEVEPKYDIEGSTVYWLDVERKNVLNRTNATTQIVKLENIALPDNITKMDIVSNGNIILLAHSDSITFIEKTTSYFQQFNNQRFISSSPNGQSIIAKSSQDKLNFIDTRISEVFDEVEHKIIPVEITLEDINGGSIDWSFDSSFFIYKNIDGDIEARDRLGNNPTVLIENDEKRIGNYPYSLTSNSRALFVVLQDGTKETSKFNMYKLNFENQQ